MCPPTFPPRYDIQYTRPGCYKGFTHCHITEHGQQCHNDTMICVCEDDLCNRQGRNKVVTLMFLPPVRNTAVRLLL